MAKKFFYVCAGILMLAMAYQFGASTARGQGIGIDAAGVAHSESSPTAAVVVSGALWVRAMNGATVGPFSLPKPGHVVAIEGSPAGTVGGAETAVCTLLYEDGDFYSGRPPLGWDYGGNILSGGGTPIQRETWGQLKAAYRK